jgi:Transglycosylase SLT domain
MPGPVGYQVGNAFVQVHPRFQQFHRKMAAELAKVGDVNIPAQMDLDTRKAQAAAKAIESRLVKHPVTVPLEVDARKLNAQIAAILAKRDEKLLGIDLDLSKLREKIADLNRHRDDLKINVDAEIAGAEAKIRTLEAQRHTVTVQADADTARAEQKLNQLDNHLTRIGNNQTDINMEASDASRAVAILGLLVAGLSAVSYAAPAAAAALAAVPNAILAMGQAVGTIGAAFSGIGDAVGALQAVEDEAATKSDTNSQKRVSAANRVAGAQSALNAALINADRSAIQSSRQLQDARESLADAHTEAASRVRDAEDNLAAAQLSAKYAQQALNDARKEAKERLEDLRISVAGAALDEEAASLAVDKAREKLEAAKKSGLTGRDLQEVDLAYRQAAQRLVEVRERFKDLKTESTAANKAGVNGSREVVAAQRQVGDATSQVHAAERALTQARIDGDRRVAKAEQALRRTRQDASFAAADASRQVTEAQRAMAQASVSAGTAGSAAMDKLDLAMKKLTPEGRAFARFLQDEAKPALQELGAAAQGSLLPKVQVAFKQLLTLSPLLKTALADTGNVLGDLAIKGAKMVTSGPWRADFVTIASRNNRMLASMGDAGLSLLDAFRNITVASGPLMEGILASTSAWSEHFAVWIQGKRDSGELQTWFREMGIRIHELWEVLSQLVGGVWNTIEALAPLGRAILHIVAPLVEMIGQFAEANPVLTTIIGLVLLLGSGFVSFFRTLGGLAQAFKTARGVFDQIIFGTSRQRDATKGATDALNSHTQATSKWQQAAATQTGAVGKVSGAFQSLSLAYQNGANRAGEWGGRTSAAVVGGVQKVDAALSRFTDSLFMVDTTMERSKQKAGVLSTGFVTSMTTMARVAGGTGAAIKRGVGGAISGLVGALGGGWGIAISAAVIALGFLVDAQARAAQKAQEHKARIQTLTDALMESNGVIDENIIKLQIQQLEESGAADTARKLGLDVGVMARAIASGGDAAEGFEDKLRGVGSEILNSAGFPQRYGTQLNNLIGEFLDGGISIEEFKDKLNGLRGEWYSNTQLTDTQKEALANQFVALHDLLGLYDGAKGTFDTAQQGQKDLKDAQNSAATATERHAAALHELNNAALESVNKALAYRTAMSDLKDAQAATAQATADHGASSREAKAALQQEESVILRVIAAAGELAFANSKATTESGKKKDADEAMIRTAVDLANKYGVKLPKALEQYLTQLGYARDATGKWIKMVRNAPGVYKINVNFDDKLAKKRLQDWEKRGLHGYLSSGVVTKRGVGGKLFLAEGGIVTPYANGGMRPMSGASATIVPPNSMRLIGDRMRGDEAYIPLDKSARSLAILAQAAERMGFTLTPMALGGLLRMANGGMATPGGQPKKVDSDPAALDLQPVAVDAFTTSVQELVGAGLAPLANEVNMTTAPAMASMELHAGKLAPAAINRLNSLMPPLQAQFNRTAAVSGQTWSRIVSTSGNSVSRVGSYLGSLRGGMTASRTAMTSMANAAVSQFGRMRPAAADPIRWILANPINAGLIGAWARLNKDFALKKPVSRVPIPFAFGGRVPGFGNTDKVDAKLMPQEYVLSKSAVANLGGVAQVDRMHRMARAGLIGPGARLGGKGDALERLKLMRTIPLDGLGFAYGGVQPHVARAGQEIERRFGPMPGGIGGVGARGNVSDHPSGHALDFMTMSNAALGDRVARYLQANSRRLLVKYLIWKQRINEGTAWKQMEDRGSVTANHFDHVHSSFLRAGQLGRQFTGAGPGIDLMEYFEKAYKLLDKVPRLFPGNKPAEVGESVARQATNGAVRFANDRAFAFGTSGNVESWRPLVMRALSMLGLPRGWANITLQRMRKESGGNPQAINLSDSNALRGDPSKGLMQVIGSTFRAHRDNRAPNNVFDPLANILASMKYTMSRYGSLPAGYGRPGGYDDGGLVPPGYSTIHNGLRRPEALLSPTQWNALISLATDNSRSTQLTGELRLSSGEFLGVVQGVIEESNTNSGRALARRLR